MIDAMAEVVALRGYGAATVADVIERAGVSRKTFYEHFRDKEDCFLEAYEAGVEILMATMRDGGDSVRARIGAFLRTLAAEPAFARTFVIEVGAAGPRALDRRQQVHEAFAAMVGNAPEALACVGATNELVAREITQGRTSALPEIEDLVVSIYERLL
jgi:AcrR family transcriptional regulator